jgi:hypothetical protein
MLQGFFVPEEGCSEARRVRCCLYCTVRRVYSVALSSRPILQQFWLKGTVGGQTLQFVQPVLAALYCDVGHVFQSRRELSIILE